MRILLVTATTPEIAPLLQALPRTDVDVLTTGVGMVPTAAVVARHLALRPYQFALNLGLCGSFNPSIRIGHVVHVVSDEMPELGAEDGAAFISLQELGLMEADAFPFRAGRLVNDKPPANAALAALPEVRGITVNTVHGDEASIARVAARCAADVESMEGAAFMYACRISGVPHAQVRAVSNRVERRDRDSWDIPGAVDALCRAGRAILVSA